MARRHRVLLSNVKFVVRQGGRKRALKERRRNVHAFVIGTLTDSHGVFGIDANGRSLPLRIRYDINSGKFLTVDGHDVVVAARAALLNEDGLTVCYTEYGL